MRKTWMVFVPVLGLLFSAGASAQDDEIAALAPLSVPEIALNVDTLITDDWLQAIDDIEFIDNSPYARIKRMRELAFLTLSDTDDSHLFLGVNSDGLVGLHFRVK